MQVPGPVVVVRQADPGILRNHVVMDGQDGLRVDPDPGDLWAEQREREIERGKAEGKV